MKRDAVTFQSLRKSLATMMANAGVPERPEEEVMRHSKGMTYYRYADASLFPKKRIIDSLPSLELEVEAQNTVFSRRSLSRSGIRGGMVGATGCEYAHPSSLKTALRSASFLLKDGYGMATERSLFYPAIWECQWLLPDVGAIRFSQRWNCMESGLIQSPVAFSGIRAKRPLC